MLLRYFHYKSLFVLIAFVLLSTTAGVTFANEENRELRERVNRLEKKLNESSSRSLDQYISDFGGRIQYDLTFSDDASDSLRRTVGSGGNLGDGSEFRRLYLNVSGKIHQPVSYRVELDFAGGRATFRNAYIRYHGLPYVGEITVGRYKEPLSIQQMTSNLHLSLLSRSSMSNAFHTGWNNGVLWSRSFQDNKYNFALGTYLSNDSNSSAPNSTGGKWNVTGRLTTPLVYLFEGRQVVHLGAGYSIRQPGDASDPDTDVFRSRVRPEVNQTDNFLDIRIPSVDSYDVGSLELAGINGPLSYQIEYARQDFNRSTGSNPELDGFYVQGDFFLTGEIRPYHKKSGSFGRVVPRRPFIGDRPENGQWGPGAWQLVARYSDLDYEEVRNITTLSPSLASEITIQTIGMNWFLNSHSKWMINYKDVEQEALGDAEYLTTRFQVDF